MRRYGRIVIMLALVLAGFLSIRCHARAATPAGAPDPRPVPRVPLSGTAVSTVDNFDGVVGTLGGHGTGVDAHGNVLEWEADLSFMRGMYVARDGVIREGTFAFI